VIAGLCIGASVWFYTLLIPSCSGPTDPGRLLRNGPFGIAWLRPQTLFGLSGLDPITHGRVLEPRAQCVGVRLGVAHGLRRGFTSALQSARSLGMRARSPRRNPACRRPRRDGRRSQELLECFLGGDRASALSSNTPHARVRTQLLPHERADPDFVRVTDIKLAGALGASSARLVMASMLRGRDMQLEDVVRLLDETSHVIQFNRELLRAALEHLSQGVSVVGRGACGSSRGNMRYLELFDYPVGMVVVGRPIEELLRFNAGRGLLHAADVEGALSRRLDHMRGGTCLHAERELPAASCSRSRAIRCRDGGFVTTYSDVTAHKRTQRALRDANENARDSRCESHPAS
jgi:hypothetical protein